MRSRNRIVIFALLCITACSSAYPANDCLQGFSGQSDPRMVGNKLAGRFLAQSHSQYGSPLRAMEPRTQITYPDVCVWLGSLWFAHKTGNKTLTRQLKARFEPVFTSEAYLLPKPNHVDNNVFGALALELYLETDKPKYRTLGLHYADTQWLWPVANTQQEGGLSGQPQSPDARAKQKKWSDKGYSWQTRFWLDDMFMITTLQAQAYRVTRDTAYINRAAREMVLYLDSIQQPSGLFYHSPSAPFCWARGNGWMAVGMAELLRVLPSDNPCREHIMNGYLKMMAKLRASQSPDGMWRQLVDNASMWEESSGTGMFTYAMIVGVKKGWLDRDEYGQAARRGWLALTARIDKNGDVKDVCEGTDIGTSTDYYAKRKRLTGDLHGQAPVLWCCYALLSGNL
jgi:rhamnogalacturonyl hydrolase YesR